jgi:hypothetical protein
LGIRGTAECSKSSTPTDALDTIGKIVWNTILEKDMRTIAGF